MHLSLTKMLRSPILEGHVASIWNFHTKSTLIFYCSSNPWTLFLEIIIKLILSRAQDQLASLIIARIGFMKKITEEENKVRSNVYKKYYTDYVIRANGCERACFTNATLVP